MCNNDSLPFVVVYDTEHFSGEIRIPTMNDAINAAIDVLKGWMDDERAGWGPDGPTKAQQDSWNYMIGTCTTFVFRSVPGKEEPDEEDVVWDMEDNDLREIGWEDI